MCVSHSWCRKSSGSKWRTLTCRVCLVRLHPEDWDRGCPKTSVVTPESPGTLAGPRGRHGRESYCCGESWESGGPQPGGETSRVQPGTVSGEAFSYRQWEWGGGFFFRRLLAWWLVRTFGRRKGMGGRKWWRVVRMLRSAQDYLLCHVMNTLIAPAVLVCVTIFVVKWLTCWVHVELAREKCAGYWTGTRL